MKRRGFLGAVVGVLAAPWVSKAVPVLVERVVTSVDLELRTLTYGMRNRTPGMLRLQDEYNQQAYWASQRWLTWLESAKQHKKIPETS